MEILNLGISIDDNLVIVSLENANLASCISLISQDCRCLERAVSRKSSVPDSDSDADSAVSPIDAIDAPDRRKIEALVCLLRQAV